MRFRMQRETQGIAAGVAAADAIIAMRSNDGSGTPNRPYTLAPAPGVYQPTPPGFVPPTYAGWAELPPFTMTSPSQFRSPPGALFNLASNAYATDYAEVKAVGDARVRGAAPDSERSDIARFWPAGGGDWTRPPVIAPDRNSTAGSTRACSRCSTSPRPTPRSRNSTPSTRTTSGARSAPSAGPTTAIRRRSPITSGCRSSTRRRIPTTSAA